MLLTLEVGRYHRPFLLRGKRAPLIPLKSQPWTPVGLQDIPAGALGTAQLPGLCINPLPTLYNDGWEPVRFEQRTHLAFPSSGFATSITITNNHRENKYQAGRDPVRLPDPSANAQENPVLPHQPAQPVFVRSALTDLQGEDFTASQACPDAHCPQS